MQEPWELVRWVSEVREPETSVVLLVVWRELWEVLPSEVMVLVSEELVPLEVQVSEVQVSVVVGVLLWEDEVPPLVPLVVMGAVDKEPSSVSQSSASSDHEHAYDYRPQPGIQVSHDRSKVEAQAYHRTVHPLVETVGLAWYTCQPQSLSSNEPHLEVVEVAGMDEQEFQLGMVQVWDEGSHWDRGRGREVHRRRGRYVANPALERW